MHRTGRGKHTGGPTHILKQLAAAMCRFRPDRRGRTTLFRKRQCQGMATSPHLWCIHQWRIIQGMRDQTMKWDRVRQERPEVDLSALLKGNRQRKKARF